MEIGKFGGGGDVVIRNARLADVLEGVIREVSVVVEQGRVTCVLPGEIEPEPEDAGGRPVVDAAGRYLLPGFIDGHVHIESSMLCPARFAELVLPFGTTTVMADPHEIANVSGLAGLRYMLDATEDLPLDVRVMLPSCVPALPVEDAGATLAAADLVPLMQHPRVAGLGEMMNVPGVLAGDADVLAKIRLAREAGKVVDGHSPGLSGPDLQAYAAAGVSTAHECTSPDEMLEHLRCGMYVLLREGSAARDLLRLLPAVTPRNARRCLFCTDDRQAADILTRGHINSHLRLCVEAGLDPVEAVRMATLNAAECYGLRDRGALAPGRRADMVLVDNLRDFNVAAVWSAGRLVARDGRMTQSLPQTDAGPLNASVHLAPLPEDAFAVSVPSGRARVIGLEAHSLVTRSLTRDVAVTEDGLFDFARNPGMLKIAVIERHHATGRRGVGLLDAGYGLRNGAIATSVAHDSHNIVVAGDNDADMRLAVEELARMGGGVIMAAAGEVLARLPLPVGGLMSDAPASEVAARLQDMLRLARDHYRIWDQADAFMTLSFLALPVIPELKITARGLFDVQAFRFVPVDADRAALSS